MESDVNRVSPHLIPVDFGRSQARVGIVHLGLGNFHRAHQAVYTQAALQADDRWGICGVSLRSAGVVRELRAQGMRYTLLERSPTGVTPYTISAIRDALRGDRDMDAIVARISAPATRIVTLTITEKGYCQVPATGRLDAGHADIVHDLGDASAPRSAPGVLLRGLHLRMAHGAPLTVVCCDNLPHNGATVRAITLELAALIDPALARWIETSVAFPSTMVDRIVPATTDADREAVRTLGLHDAVPVATEPFTQWVIEDRFAAERPRWEDGGAQFVADVGPFEMMKLRLLNGAHSAMAYLGYLAGYEFVDQVAADPSFRRMVERLWAELAPTLPPMPGIDIADYQRMLMLRFQNSALSHRTWQIAMDGSQKLPQRLVAAASERQARGEGVDTIVLAIAAWMRYATGADEQGRAIDVRDPLQPEFARIARRSADDPAALARGMLGLEQVFGPLGANAHFADNVTRKLRQLFSMGAKRVVARDAEVAGLVPAMPA